MTTSALLAESQVVTSCEGEGRSNLTLSRFDALYQQLNPETPAIAQRVFREICDFNFDREREILMSPIRGFEYNGSHVDEMECEYKKYLLLRLMHPNQRLPMSKDVDDFWHVHVLNTRSYQRFINEVGGGLFIHHAPTISENENMDLMPAYLNGTLVRYAQYFGEPNPKFWKRQSPHGACCGC